MIFHVGQDVYLESGNYAGLLIREVVITRVGRKWVYINEGCLETAFSAETGEEKNRYGYPRRIYTLEMKADQERRSAAFTTLNGIGLQFGFGGVERRLSTGTLEAIIAAIPESERS